MTPLLAVSQCVRLGWVGIGRQIRFHKLSLKMHNHYCCYNNIRLVSGCIGILGNDKIDSLTSSIQWRTINFVFDWMGSWRI